MPVLYLVRHGQASFGSDNYDKLSELGVRQAEIVGRALRQREVRTPVLISGTLSRQQDTARAVGASLGVHELTVDPGWDELDAHGIVDAALGAPGASSALTSQEFQVVLDRVLMQQIRRDCRPPAGHRCRGNRSSAARERQCVHHRGCMQPSR